MPTTAPSRAPSFNSPGLRSEIARLREVDNVTNLGYLAIEYLCLAAVIGGAVAFGEYRASWGLPWAWNVPVFAVAIVLIGGLMHRLAGLGHEASHYSLLRNKWANDLVGDVFCFFPILATVHFYRLFHMAHHQYTNHPELDPDLVNLGPGKMVEAFPMGRARFLLTRMLAPLTSPVSFATFQLEYIYVNVIGKGNNVYMRRVPDGDAADPRPRVGTCLGAAYLLLILAGQHTLTRVNHADWLVPFGLIGVALAGMVSYLLPDRWVFRSPFRQAYSARFAGMMRLAFYTGLLVLLGLARSATDGRSSPYVYVLGVLPWATSFPYFLLLRDTYQHTNADDGRLTNTRVFFCDPLTKWAVFVYGQDMHVPHHLFPAIPHYRLGELHRLLKRDHEDYAREVVEVHGTFANDRGLPTVLDVLTETRSVGDRPPVGNQEFDRTGSRSTA
jgi:fatty acid desaturase